jgi:predicted enzyme related to lactoylglutathione lyase
VVAAIGRLELVQVDCADPIALAGFWCQVLGVEIIEVLGDPPHYVNLEPPADARHGPALAFQRVPEPKSSKNRLHFDVAVDDVDVATAQVEAIGGSRPPIDDVSEHGYHWRVMADPDGNEFCLVFTIPA